MSNEHKQFEQRKVDHIKLALMHQNQASEFNQLDTVHLMHEALPDLNFDAVDISTTRLGIQAKTPFIVSSMTAGHEDALMLNRHLMAACAETGWAMGVGSQRRELTDTDASAVWTALRQDYPDVVLYGNLGITQLITTPVNQVIKLTDSLRASALIIHCNPLQECIQPEGTPSFEGCWDALERLIKASPVPIILKETGCGFSNNTLQRLSNMGVAAIDVSGLGGTHWGRIEGHRAGENTYLQQTAETFRNWGIDTVQSVRNAAVFSEQVEVWGSGGVRHGLDAAKLFALGATTVGFAKPMLEAAMKTADAVTQTMQTIEYELRVALFCTGSRDLHELKEKVRC
ncbi:MAG: type 2 isopentenyl-diphosphate Delta-isomerase [Gammaproteobacteria bacterium]|nr:type 2 isopentenyl-diphosphate Delta-isomerase [Gammaproteobacteria bacterium]MCH9716996.1 type 2 isopentenyl-diphosphate Delta-isomerase [Gammaproteobacteria bacterium]MCH9763690.1 type 2 isopentenyl-diphosphate Delta-isomerase [Gammaproteobacteria bacterium]